MRLGEIFMPVRAWWFLQVAKNSAPPPEVKRYLLALMDTNSLKIEELERKKQAIIDKGAADGKTISTEAVLKRLLERRATYDGPDRDEYVSEIDRIADEFRNEQGPQIPVDRAYAIVKEVEARFGRVR